MIEGQGGFLVLLDVFSYFGCKPWYSRGRVGPRLWYFSKWETARSETICGPTWTVFGLHALHAWPVRTSLGCRDRYRSGGHGGPCVSWSPPQTASLTAFGHLPIQSINHF